MKHLQCAWTLLLVLALCLGLCGAAFAADPEPEQPALTAEEKAAALTELGLFKGKADKNGNVSPALEDAANRAEAATMLIRLMGRESKAKAQYDAGALRCVFDDVPAWALPNVTWLYEGNYINGMGGTTFGSKLTVTAQQYATMVLRALGYNEKDGDFTYAGALDFAVRKGLLTEAQRTAWKQDFRRDGMVEMSYNALFLNMKFSSLTLKDKLARDGVFSGTDMSVSETPAMELTLKYAAGGHTNPTYFEEKAYGNAVCGDVDGDGRQEIVYGVFSIMCIDAETGALKWRVPSGHDITENLNPALDFDGSTDKYAPPFRLVDYDGDGQLEIFTVTNIFGSERCHVAVYDGTGHFKAHWITDRFVWAACVDDLDGDGKCEVAIGYGVGKAGMTGVPSLLLYNNDGSLRWSVPCGYGLFSDSIAAADLDGDGVKELVLLYDENGIVALHADGNEAATDAFEGREWSDILFYEAVDGREPYTTRENSIGLMGTRSGIAVDDIDSDGTQEIVGTGMFVLMGIVEDNMANDKGFSFDDSVRYIGPFILNLDRTRYTNEEKGFDWTHIPTDVGTIIPPMDNPVLDRPSVQPTLADLDGDGNKEILFSGYDGKVHCVWLDETEHGAWPYTLDSRSAAVLSFASEPAVADVNGDGKQEVIFATYTQSDQLDERGKLYVLDYSGKVLAEITLPVMFAREADISYPNGSRCAPCVADVDGDGQLEIAVTTYSCGVCVYELS